VVLVSSKSDVKKSIRKNLLNLNQMNDLIQLSPAQFKTFVEDGPRNYHLFVFFTSETDVFPCPSCSMIKPEIEKIAKYYKNSVKNSEANVFFVMLELQKGREIFEKYKDKITFLPLLVHLPPSEEGDFDFEISAENSYNIQLQTISVVKISDWIMRKARVKFEVEPPFDGSPYLLACLTVIMIIYILLKLPKLLTQIREPTFWFAGFMLVTFFSYSGMVFNFNNGPPFVYWDREKGFYWLYPGLRNQFVLEGFIMGALVLAGSLCFVFLGVVVPKVQDKQQRNSWFSYALIGSICSFIIVRFIFGAKLR